ncbi:MAG TPA: diiron oxygenase [Candidatus Saccharimonadales bacterium]|nr:diiron oxygenase [Candidatus Saccharimonadales bacterium]
METTAIQEPARAVEPTYSYQEALTASQRVNWKIEDIIGGDRRLDFSRPFMPESLARVEGMEFLTPAERRTLNQIRGNTYLYIFGLVEEFILPFVMDQARPMLHGDDWRVRALLQFATEEAKHIHLFKRFREEFEKGFGTPCEVIGPPDEIARAVLSHHPLSVALVILHIEWMTQRHYIESVRDDQDLDPQFKSLLKHHWMEEAQHAKLDTLMVEALAAACTPDEIGRAVDGYLEIGGLLDAGLMQQTAFDKNALERSTGRRLSEKESEAFMSVQRQANRWTYLGTGMTHPKVLETLERIMPGAREKMAEVAPLFS